MSLECKLCNTKFQDSDKYRFHVSNHHKKITYKCKTCLCEFSDRKAHVKVHQNNCFKDKFNCHLCQNVPGKQQYYLSETFFWKHYEVHKSECVLVRKRSKKCICVMRGHEILSNMKSDDHLKECPEMNAQSKKYSVCSC